MTRIAIVVGILLLTLLPSLPAQAQRLRTDVIGLEGTAHVGVGGFFEDSASAFHNAPNAGNHLFWPGIAAQASIGERVLPWFSLGLSAGYTNHVARDLPQGTSGGWAQTFTGGAYARFYLGALFHFDRFEPWISVGLNPYAGVWTRHYTPLGDANTRVDSIAVPITIGLDWVALRMVSAGVILQVSPWIPWQVCTSNPVSGAGCNSNNLSANTFFFLGIGGRFTAPIW